MNKKFDVIVIGSGLAGLSVALRLAEANKKVALISKKQLNECNSFYAQGGIAAVMNPDDSFASHVHDTIIAGAGLCNLETVEFIVKHAPEAIEWLINLGVPFTREKETNQKLHVTREGGHSTRRVLHVADATGEAIINNLIKHVMEHAGISVYQESLAIDLITRKSTFTESAECNGVFVLDIKLNQVDVFSAPYVVLATGGAGKAYLYTTNPDVATGDGIAMAFRSGCPVKNMEFIQFHPTCLYHEKARSFLISEAVRGEGGILLLPNGKRFMSDHDDRLELAPRDVVARAIDYEMKKHGFDCVYLDISHKPKDFVLEHFPNIYAKCLSLGIDITREPIPVVPAAHYTCGGVITDLLGKTSVNGLYAVGECANTGLHGANRLASNSLLECLVIGHALIDDILGCNRLLDDDIIVKWDDSEQIDAEEEVMIAHNWDELRRVMWDYVGIVRSDKRLSRALKRVLMLRDEISEYYANVKISPDLIELRNLVLVSELIIRSASMRKESRGLHYILDYPGLSKDIKDTVICAS